MLSAATQAGGTSATVVTADAVGEALVKSRDEAAAEAAAAEQAAKAAAATMGWSEFLAKAEAAAGIHASMPRGQTGQREIPVPEVGGRVK